jgi:hypothetical protein
MSDPESLPSRATETHDSDGVPSNWSHRRQEVGVIVWASFLTACVATMVFFAIFDPVLLASDENPPAWLANRMTGYAIGFFFFWVITLAAAVLTAYLLDTLPQSKKEESNLAAKLR